MWGERMSTEPEQLKGARRCGAKCRGPRAGRPCQAPAMPNGRCRMHGGWSGGPRGSRNGAYKDGLHTIEAKEGSAWARGVAKDAEGFLATTLDRLGQKPAAALSGP